MYSNKEIAERLVGLREACGYSQEDLAAAIGVDAEVYKGYERNGEDIPISVIYQVAKLCGVDFADIITGISAKLDTYYIVKSGEGTSVSRYPGYDFKDLAFRYNNKIMQPLLVTLDPSDEPAELVSHSGQEFNFVLSGTVILTFDDKELVLEQGDSIYFNPTHLHGQKCGSAKPAVFLTVIVE